MTRRLTWQLGEDRDQVMGEAYDDPVSMSNELIFQTLMIAASKNKSHLQKRALCLEW